MKEIRYAKIKATIFATTALVLALNAPAPAQAFKFPGQSDSASTSCQKGKEMSNATPEKKEWVKSKILIKAPPDVVWFSVHEERNHDPDIAYSKVIEKKDNESKLEQKFTLIPMIGTAVCLMHQNEILNERIDYKLIQSDHFKAMEGSWVLSPAENGKATILELSTHLDLGVPVPKMIMNSMTQKKLDKRLAHVKQMAEDTHTKNLEVAALKEKESHL